MFSATGQLVGVLTPEVEFSSLVFVIEDVAPVVLTARLVKGGNWWVYAAKTIGTQKLTLQWAGRTCC